MSQPDQKQDGKISLSDGPFRGFRQLSTQDYHVDNIFDLQRWMCQNCGLIFDYQFNDEEPGWPVLDYDHLLEVDEEGYPYRVEGAPHELCSRCGVDLSEQSLLVKVGRSDFNFAQLTFVVEDATHERVVKAIAKNLGKKLQVLRLGSSSQVIAFFNSMKTQEAMAKSYYLIDGDNNPKKITKEPNFIQLDKYCMENYLLDFEICGEISNKEPRQICATVLEVVKQSVRGGGGLLNLLFNRLSESDITDESLKHVDGAPVWKSLLKKLAIGEEVFIEKYVAKCHERSKMEIILPSRIVEVIKNA